MKDGASSVVNTHLNSQVSTECDVRNTEPYLVRAAAPVLAINQRFRFQKQKSCAPHAARPSARSPHGEAALPQVGGDDVGVAPRDGNGHGAVDAVHDLLGCPHILELCSLLDEAPDELRGFLAQASGRLDCKCDKLACRRGRVVHCDELLSTP